MRAKACKRLLLEHPFSIVPPDKLPEHTAILVTCDKTATAPPNTKLITVHYDFQRAPENDSSAFELPFFVHPEIHESGQVEQFLTKPNKPAQRPMSILFAGNAKSPKYDEPVLAENTTSSAASKHSPAQSAPFLQNKSDALAISPISSPLLNSARVSPSPPPKTFASPSSQWIETLALADFYFAWPRRRNASLSQPH